MKDFLQRTEQRLTKISRENLLTLYSQLLERNKKLDTLINSLPEAIVVFDLDGIIVYQNNVPERKYGLLPSSEGKKIWDLLPDKELVKTMQAALSKNKDVDEILQMQHEESEQFFYTRFRTLPYVQNNKIKGTILTIVDYTVEQEYIEELIRRGRINSLADISAGLAHEVKNPLSSISIHAHLLKKQIDKIPEDTTMLDKKKIHKYFRVIREEIFALNEVTAFFLNNMKKENIAIDVKDLNEVVLLFLEFVQEELNQKKITCKIAFSDTPVMALISQSAIRHVLLNLVKNAMESMENGGALTIETYSNADVVQLAISDTGTGIAPDIQEKIFNPYFTTKDAGTGIGLSIVERIMQIHNGKILLDRNYTKGARFILEFPAYAKYWLSNDS